MNLVKKSIVCLLLLCFAAMVSREAVVRTEENQTMVESPDEEIYFTLLHTNDEHSSLIPHTPAVDYRPESKNPTVGGYGRLATELKRIREEKSLGNEEVLLVSAGDFIGGTAFSWLVPRGLAVELMIKHRLGYNAVTVGNHEYDYGTKVLAEYLQAAGYPKAHEITPILATNTYAGSDHTSTKQGLYKKYHVIELNQGVKVGFFGLIGKDAVSVAANAKTVSFSEEQKAAQEAVCHLKEQGADIIIALSHSGVDSDLELARQAAGIDIIIGGHSHTSLIEPIQIGKTIIVQAGAYLEYLGILELAYNLKTGALRLRNGECGQSYLIRMDSNIPCDPEITTLINGYIDELNQLISDFTEGKFNHVLGSIAKAKFPIRSESLKESPFGNFVTDAMRFITWEKMGKRVDVAIQANGSIRGSLIPGSMDYSRGLVSFYDLASLVGLGYGSDGYAGYPIVSFYLTGEEIRRALEAAALLAETKGDTYFLQFSGLRYSYNPQDAVLFMIPIKNMPVPTTRAVKKAEIYKGDGIQSLNAKDYTSLDRGDDKLYHVVSDSNILSFLPLAGQFLPQLDIKPKDYNGKPVPLEDFDRLIVYNNGRQLKVWQTVVEYAASQELGEDRIPIIPDYYASVSGRINPIRTIPLLLWFVLLLAGIGVIVTVFVVRIYKRHKWEMKL